MFCKTCSQECRLCFAKQCHVFQQRWTSIAIVIIKIIVAFKNAVMFCNSGCAFSSDDSVSLCTSDIGCSLDDKYDCDDNDDNGLI